MKKRAKTPRTKTPPAKGKTSKRSTTTRAKRGGKPKAKTTSSRKTPRSAAETKQPKRSARKPSAASEKLAAGPAGATEGVRATRDPRLPPVGTVLKKRDRHGAVRCECEVTAEGVRYQGNAYRSLSAAAVAAAKDLGLAAKAMNGFTFWGLVKPPRPAADPLAALERAWDRYALKVESVLEGAKSSDEGPQPVLKALLRHARVLKNLHDEVAQDTPSA